MVWKTETRRGGGWTNCFWSNLLHINKAQTRWWWWCALRQSGSFWGGQKGQIPASEERSVAEKKKHQNFKTWKGRHLFHIPLCSQTQASLEVRTPTKSKTKEMLCCFDGFPWQKSNTLKCLSHWLQFWYKEFYEIRTFKGRKNLNDWVMNLTF